MGIRTACAYPWHTLWLACGDCILAPPSIAPPLVLGLPVVFAGGELPFSPPRLGSSPLPKIGQRAIAHLVCVWHSHGLAERPPFGWGFSQGLQRGNPTFAPCPGFFGFRRTLCPTAVNCLVFASGWIPGSRVFSATPLPLGLPLSPWIGCIFPFPGKCVQNGRWPCLPFLVHRVVILGFCRV
jgi:hypothetical protein